MKDYRLSEMEFCDCHCPYHGEPNGCNRPEGECEAYRQYLELVEFEKEIKSGDMIELPCKRPITAINEQVLLWQVLYNSPLFKGEVLIKHFGTEAEADAFIAQLKGDKE